MILKWHKKSGNGLLNAKFGNKEFPLPEDVKFCHWHWIYNKCNPFRVERNGHVHSPESVCIGQKRTSTTKSSSVGTKKLI